MAVLFSATASTRLAQRIAVYVLSPAETMLFANPVEARCAVDERIGYSRVNRRQFGRKLIREGHAWVNSEYCPSISPLMHKLSAELLTVYCQ